MDLGFYFLKSNFILFPNFWHRSRCDGTAISGSNLKLKFFSEKAKNVLFTKNPQLFQILKLQNSHMFFILFSGFSQKFVISYNMSRTKRTGKRCMKCRNNKAKPKPNPNSGPKELMTHGSGKVFHPNFPGSKAVMFPTNVKPKKIDQISRELFEAKRTVAIQRHLLASVGLERNLTQVEKSLQDPSQFLPENWVSLDDLPKVCEMNRLQLEEEIRIGGFSAKLELPTERKRIRDTISNRLYLPIDEDILRETLRDLRKESNGAPMIRSLVTPTKNHIWHRNESTEEDDIVDLDKQIDEPTVCSHDDLTLESYCSSPGFQKQDSDTIENFPLIVSSPTREIERYTGCPRSKFPNSNCYYSETVHLRP